MRKPTINDFVIQPTFSSCGPTAITNCSLLLKEIQNKMEYLHKAKEICKTDRNGTSDADMESALGKYFNYRKVGGNLADIMFKQADKGLPVILEYGYRLPNKKIESHYVTFVKIDKNYYLLNYLNIMHLPDITYENYRQFMRHKSCDKTYVENNLLKRTLEHKLYVIEGLK